ncbi:arsenical pump-driving ATPase [Streptomyces sp. NPDC004976]
MPPAGLASLLESVNTRYLFFTGKGGVGKTSTACATAVALADRGRTVLLVSTDPASNLDEVLETPIGTRPTEVPSVPGLSALNVDPEQAAAAYRERVIGPYREALPASAVARVEEQLSGACTVEIAAFDEFTALLTDDPTTAGFDHIVFDTAPTGHTLRLLALPAAWSTFIGDGTGTSCLGPLSGLQAQQGRYAEAVAALTDPARTTLLLVTRPEPAALTEAERAGAELRRIGVVNQRLIVNGLFEATAAVADPLAAALDRQARAALESMPDGLGQLPRTTVGLLTVSPTGIDGLRHLAGTAHVPVSPGEAETSVIPQGERFEALVDEIAAVGSGLVMTMGKGGVGKTTIAAAVAVALAARGHRVQLTTTDPAAHVAGALGSDLAGVEVSRIDPVAETAAYTAEVLASAGAELDDDARAVLEEDLASPCTEEIAVFQAFARTVARAQHGFVVVDTAPTGHTLLLLDAARSYHRELTRQSGQMPEHVLHLLDRLRDPARTHVLLVALPEATPVHEAARLQADLARTGITPTAWFLNQSLAAAQPSDPLLRARAGAEHRYIDEVAATLARRVVILPRVAQAPVGASRLQALVGDPVAVSR